MIQKILTIMVLGIMAQTISAQQIEYCMYDRVIELKDDANPGYKEALYRNIETLAASQKLRNDDEIYTVKVVFHVVYNAEEENIDDEYLERQISVLNECFRRTNADTVNLREIFWPVAADSGIEFEIADIIRVQTNATFRPTLFELPDEVKETSKGGSDIVDPEYFLNIWVCKILPIEFLGLESPVLGYAYPPDNLIHWPQGSAAPERKLEGVVIDYRAMRYPEYVIPGFGSIPMEGKTTVHEVGHYLGLRHISGDGGLLGINCEGSDGVDDTPTQGKQSDFDCNPNQNTCGAGEPSDLPDMIENYMDYSSESCQNTFTKGQVAIMRAVLEGPRKLLTSLSDVTQAKDFLMIYPNPTSGYFAIEKVGSESDVVVDILDMTGRKVLSQTIHNHELVDVNHLEPGIYFVQIDRHAVKKLIIAR